MTKRIVVKGAVQGIGYRPFISEKATEYGLSGYVKNCGASVEILVSGAENDVDSFVFMLSKEVPAGGFIFSVEATDMDQGDLADSDAKDDDASYCTGDNFVIIESSVLDLSSELPVFLPDIGICDDCMSEMLDPSNRRYRYPLISCAVCGPRMSILNRLPYDRDTTTMEDFCMCPSCQKDYGIGRRKYAQTISCHDCGPQMILKLRKSATFESGEKSVKKAIELLAEGKIIGLKGISGYQLVCKPEAEIANRLRKAKGRENKPFALMFSTVEDIRKYAFVSELEEKLLKSSARPIVLVKATTASGKSEFKKDGGFNSCEQGFPEEVLKGSLYIGAFLPSAGIHRLLTDALGPLIVTSANKSDEPMIIDDDKFLSVFMPCSGKDSDYENADTDVYVDAVLYHKRRINMAQDDSVMFVINVDGRETSQFVRRARGFAPLPVIVDPTSDNNDLSSTSYSDRVSSDEHKIGILALGGDLKSSFAFGKGDRIIPSQYIGDLKDYEVNRSYGKLLNDYQRIFEFKPEVIISDLHPLYMSTKMGKELSDKEEITRLELQHHFAHIYSVMAENSLTECIGVSFDGTGFGLDGNIWGGEFVYCKGSKAERILHLSYAKLAGGDEAPKNAGNVALCYIHEAKKRGLINVDSDSKILLAALDNNINTFETSSMGRLFDAVSALLGICSYNSYEGECAIMLEKEALLFEGDDYPKFSFSIRDDEADQISLFADIYRCLLEGNYSKRAIAYGFHMAIKDLITKASALLYRKFSDMDSASVDMAVCLSGGVFNNRLLLTSSVKALRDEGFEVYWNQKVPLGDGGISTGQAYYGLLNS